MLSLNQVTLKINMRMIFQNISISFMPGAIVYLSGKNGSGKTSLLRIIADIVKTTSGNITISRDNILMHEVKKPYCVYIGHRLAIKNDLTVYENILSWAKMYNNTNTLAASVHYLGLKGLLDKKCYELSEGNKKKIAMTRLMLSSANIWLLDEMDNNLDKDNKMLLNNLIVTKANNGGIIIMATHNMPDIKGGIMINMSDYL